MISQQRILQLNRGFSLIEIIVSIVVIGIISVVGIPLYQYLSGNYNQTRVDETALIIQSDFSKIIADNVNTSSFKYPLQGKSLSDGSTAGYYNISDNDFINFCVVLFNLTPTLYDNEKILNKTINKGVIKSYKSEVCVTITCKSGTQIQFTFSFNDNSTTYADNATLSSFTYVDHNGYSKCISMV